MPLCLDCYKMYDSLLAAFRLPSTSLPGGTSWLQPGLCQSKDPLPSLFFMVRKPRHIPEARAAVLWKILSLDDEGTRSLKEYHGTSQSEFSPWAYGCPGAGAQWRDLCGPYHERAGWNNMQEQLLYGKNTSVLPEWGSIKEVLTSLYVQDSSSDSE